MDNLYTNDTKTAIEFLPDAKKFPIRPDTKRPMFAGWQASATNDPVQLASWAEEFPGCAWAIACAESGLIGVEVDPKARRVAKDANSEQAGFAGAAQAWIALCTEWGLPPLVPHVRSRSGGYHIYFRAPEGVDVKELKQRGLVRLDGWQQHVIETRVNGFLLIPPSEFEGRAYTRWPNGPSEPYAAPAGLIEALQPAAAQPGIAPSDAIVKPGSYDLRALAAYICRVHHTVGLSRDAWRAAIFALVSQYGRGVAFQIAHAIHDGEANTTAQIDDLVSRAREEFRPGDSTLDTLFKFAHENGISDIVPKSAAAMFGCPAPALDIDAILAEIDAPVISSPPLAPLPPLLATPAAEIVSPAPASMPRGGSLMGPRGEILPIDADESLALDFASTHADDLRYVEEIGRWLIWTGQRWRPDKTSSAYYLVRQHLRGFATTMQFQEARKVASARTVAAVERMARTDPRIATEADKWDADPFLLNTPGGVVDLRKGAIRDARPSDHMTKITAVAPGGDCPLWKSFLDKALGGDAELINFIQRMLGYALTGDTREHALFFLYGQGGNGKGVLINTVTGILGDYAKTAAADTFIDSPHQQHPTDLAGLRGARLVTASETQQGRRWDEAKIKMLTGGDRISARFMRQDFFEFVPQFKLVIAGNHKPALRNVDAAMRRRMHLVPFSVNIPEGERDTSLPERLKAEWGGILAWLVEGCLAWQRDGLQPPATVRAATEAYLASEDVLGAWLEDRCEMAGDAWASRPELFLSWSGWAIAAREHVGTSKQFIEAMRGRGFEEGGRVGVRGFRGVRLRQMTPPPPPLSR